MRTLTKRILQKETSVQLFAPAIIGLLLIVFQTQTANAQSETHRGSVTNLIHLSLAQPQDALSTARIVGGRGSFRFNNRMIDLSGSFVPRHIAKPNVAGKPMAIGNASRAFLTGGTGTTSRLAKWIDNSGTLGDAAAFEANGLTFFGLNHAGQTAPLFTGSDYYHVLEIGATGVKSPLTLAGGNAVMEMWRDLGGGTGAPAAAVSYGMAKPGTAVTDDLVFATYKAGIGWDERVRVKNTNGNFGIGVSNPAEKLDVLGNVKITGNINVSGNINAKFQDIAEWVPTSEQIPAGTVVVLDSSQTNHVVASAKAYDTRVAGVISAQPGITLGERGESKVLVATTGRVRVKVDASHGPIQIGDLLVTSGEPGMAMKSQPISLGEVQIHRPGTLIGKALEPLAKGTGEILVLLSLQ
jgi:hypothetical protein